jgi:hypothetical protein
MTLALAIMLIVLLALVLAGATLRRTARGTL